MKIEDEHIGGKEVEPVRFRFKGDNAKQYTGIGRGILGDLKRQIQLATIDPDMVIQNQVTKRLKDGTIIHAHSIFGRDGQHDIDTVHIDTTSRKDGKIRILGYIVKGFCTLSSDPTYSQYLYFPVTVGKRIFDPTTGTDPGGVVFDNYPDSGAKYETRGDETCDEVFFAHYDRVFPLLSTTGPSRIDYDPLVPADPGQPPLNSGFSWGTYWTCYYDVDGFSGHHSLGIKHDFVYVQKTDPEAQYYYPLDYPGGEAGWVDDFDVWAYYRQYSVWIPAINNMYADEYANDLLNFGNDDEHFYSTVENGYWIRKEQEDYGFTSNLGFYRDDKKVYVVSERHIFNEGTNVGQGFLFMVNTEPSLKIGQSIIDSNDLHTKTSLGVTEDIESLAGGFEHNVGVNDVCQIGPPVLPEGGIRPEVPLGSQDHAWEPATFEVGDYFDFSVLKEIFKINCKVQSGVHSVDIKRHADDDDYKYRVEVEVYTDDGIYIVKKDVGEFPDGIKSITKLTIPVDIPIEPEEIYSI